MSITQVAINIDSNGQIADAVAADGRSADEVSVVDEGGGVYQIRGAIGFAASGWRSSIPRDENGQLMCALDVLNDDGFRIAVTPAIPEGRTITLRLDVVAVPEESE